MTGLPTEGTLRQWERAAARGEPEALVALVRRMLSGDRRVLAYIRGELREVPRGTEEEAR